MDIALWMGIFVVALAVLVKGADWVLDSAERIGLAIGLSPFVVGVVLVGVGTSLPELVSSLAATFKDVTEVVVANAVGSNITNILLVVGFAAVFGRRLTVTKDLIDLDLPVLAITTSLFLGVAWDRVVTLPEAVLLLGAVVVYFLYTVFHRDEEGSTGLVMLSSEEKKRHISLLPESIKIPKDTFKDFGLLAVGTIALVIGAKYLIDAVIELSVLLDVGAGVISIVAVALGTSLPELLVSVKAALKNKPEVALGNIFGSNTFNLLVVVGIPGLFRELTIDGPTFGIGLPVMAVVTLLFIISGISKRIHIWEGAFYLLAYVLFVAKVFNFF